jgi:hypothetical protein
VCTQIETRLLCLQSWTTLSGDKKEKFILSFFKVCLCFLGRALVVVAPVAPLASISYAKTVKSSNATKEKATDSITFSVQCASFVRVRFVSLLIFLLFHNTFAQDCQRKNCYCAPATRLRVPDALPTTKVEGRSMSYFFDVLGGNANKHHHARGK